MDATLAEVLPAVARFEPESEVAFFGELPAKWCVALLSDASGQPLQLMCAKNLRATLRRRLESADPTNPPSSPTKRIDYRELVRSVRWRRVDGEFEMDFAYVEGARQAFPAHWRRLVPERSAWFVACDADASVPDFVRDTTPDMPGQVFGPFADRSKADRWIDAVRDAFDLCRYRNILAQAPHGRACAYKQMNKCPAPCDGTITLDAFREHNVRPAVAAMRDPSIVLETLTATMQRHAIDLEFEQAGRAKARAAAIANLSSGAFKGVRPIEAFRYVTVQPGPRKGTARVFLVTLDAVVEVAGILDGTVPLSMVEAALDRAPLTASDWPADVLLGTICHHLGGTKSSTRFVERERLDQIALSALLKAAMKIETAADDAEPVRETRLQLSA